MGVNGNNDTVTGDIGNDTIWVAGNNDSVTGGTGNDLIGVNGNNDKVNAGPGNDTVYSSGDHNTVVGGGHDQIDLGGTNNTFLDSAPGYADTVVGFDKAGGDRIDISATGHSVASMHLVNSNQDTLITLTGGSTILLKFVTNVDNSFFS